MASHSFETVKRYYLVILGKAIVLSYTANVHDRVYRSQT